MKHTCRTLALALALMMALMLLPMAALARTVVDNQFYCSKVSVGDVMENNYGEIGTNYGTVTNNRGKITNNHGTVTNNLATITNNYGIVSVTVAR